jgi:hypothetical protein
MQVEKTTMDEHEQRRELMGLRCNFFYFNPFKKLFSQIDPW